MFIWVGGGLDSEYFEKLKTDMEKLDIKEQIIFAGHQIDPYIYYSIFSVFLFPSREESFGLVVLENAFLSKPIICFKKCGGVNEFISDSNGIEVPYLDIAMAVNSLIELRKNNRKRKLLGENARANIISKYSKEIFDSKVLEIPSLLRINK